MFSFQATQVRLLLLERPQPFNLATEPDELLAIDAGFLELPELLLVRDLYRGPARFEPFLDTPDSLIGRGKRHIERLRDFLKIRVQLFQYPISLRQDLPSGKIFQRFGRKKGSVDRQLLPQLIQTGTERLQALGYRIEHALFPHQQALLLEILLEASFLIALECLFEPRQGSQSIIDIVEFLASRQHPAARTLQLPMQFSFPGDRRIIFFHETTKQPGQLLRALRKFRNLVLAVNLDTPKDIRHREVQHVACLRIANNGRVRDCPLDPVVPSAWTMATHEERHLRTTSEHVSEYSRMGRPSFLTQRFQPKHMTQAFNHRRLAGTAATHQNVQIRIEVERGTVQKPALPPHRDKFRPFRGWRLAVQSNPRSGIEERLPQAFGADFGHLDPACSGRIRQVFRRYHVRGVYHRDGKVRFRRVFPDVVRVSILDNWSDVNR